MDLINHKFNEVYSKTFNFITRLESNILQDIYLDLNSYKKELGNKLKEALKSEIKEQLKEELKGEINEELKKELKDEIMKELKKNIN